MNEQQNPTNTTAEAQREDEAQYQGELSAAWETTVEAMTTAVRLIHPTHGPVDFADFVASALAAVAANVGSSSRLVAGRPGSWEAAHVLNLVGGTVGHGDEYLVSHRTEPVVVPLNVRQVVIEDVWSRAEICDTPYDEEITNVVGKYEALPEAEHDIQAEQGELQAVDDRWVARYVAYASAFRAAVMVEAARIEGLAVSVTVEAYTGLEDGEGPLNPDEIDDPDPLVLRLWDAARRAVPLPSTDGSAIDTAEEVSGQ